jgi:hypothetical protein
MTMIIMGFVLQSYEDPDILDSAVLVAPLVFFCPASVRIRCGRVCDVTLI